MKIIKSVNILGDSISKGIVLDNMSRKYKILKQSAIDLFGRENHIDVSNFSRFGCTSQKALNITDEIPEKTSANDTNLVMVELGGNDCDYNWDDVASTPDAPHIPNVPLAQFRENVRHIITMLQKSGRRIAFMTLPPIDSEKYFNWISRGDNTRAANILKFLGDKTFIYRHQELYADALRDTATELGVFRIPVREHFLGIRNYSDLLCDDGIHLNENGQHIMESVFTETYKNYLANK